MAQGLQVWDGNQKIIFDTNYRISRVLGTIPNAGLYTKSGSVSDGRFATGTPFFLVSPKIIGQSQYGQNLIGFFSITVSNNVLNWTVDYADSGKDAGTIIYGVY